MPSGLQLVAEISSISIQHAILDFGPFGACTRYFVVDHVDKFFQNLLSISMEFTCLSNVRSFIGTFLSLWIGTTMMELSQSWTFFRSFTIFYMEREVNSADYVLTKAVVFNVLDSIWVEETPTYISDIVFRESSRPWFWP
jgi:hypothetical protein